MLQQPKRANAAGKRSRTPSPAHQLVPTPPAAKRRVPASAASSARSSTAALTTPLPHSKSAAGSAGSSRWSTQPMPGSARRAATPSPTSQAAADLNEASSILNSLMRLPADAAPVSSMPTSSRTATGFVTQDSQQQQQQQQPVHLLQSMFNSLDNVMCLIRLRKQLCTFERIKPHVQRSCGREFTLEHLARILTVYPAAFRVHRVPLPGAHARSEQHFDIALDLDDDDSIKVVAPVRAERKLVERQQEFARRLRDATAQHCRCAAATADAGADTTAATCLATASACEGGCIPAAALPPLRRAAAETAAAAARAPNLTTHVAALTPPDPDSPSPRAPVDMDPIVARLRARDSAAAAAAARSAAEVAAEERRRCSLPALADALRASLRQRRRTSDYLAAVAADLAATLPARLPPREVARRLRMLPAVVPEWCSVDDGGGGGGGSSGGGAARKPVLRVNWELDYAEVRSMLLFMLTDSNDEAADGGGGGSGSSGGSRSHAGSIGAGAARLMQAVR